MMIKKIIIIPLHLPLNYPCDYIDQTAKVLSQKNTVILFDYYHQYSWKNLLKKNNLKIFLNSIFNILKSKKLVYFRPFAIFPFQRFKIINKINQFFGYLLLSLIIEFIKKKAIIWQFFPLIKSFFIKKLFKQIFIYDCVDYLDEKIHEKKIINEEKTIIKKSDYVAFNSLPLAKAKGANLNNKKFIITYCGCDFDQFNIIPFIMNKENIAIFYGIFDYRINVSILKKTINDNTNWQFLLIGPVEEKNHPPKKDFLNLLKIKNVLYLGKKPKNELANYLKKAKIGLIPYDTSYNFVKYSNPMKTYEYLAAGLPVLSTEILSLKQYPKEIVYTTDNPQEFSKTLDFLTKNWNIKKALKAKEIAKTNSWENKIEIILKKTNL
ncbi:MAG: glycosyltransferase [Microgenomates group bacterium]